MHKNLDWTEKVDQNLIAEKAIYVVEELLEEINKNKLDIFSKYNLQKDEISLIFIYPLFKATNIFIDRLLIAIERENLIKALYFQQL